MPMDGPAAGWPAYGGQPYGTCHSPLTQIRREREDVERLEVAWTDRTGGVSDGSTYPRRSSFEATPQTRGSMS